MDRTAMLGREESERSDWERGLSFFASWGGKGGAFFGFLIVQNVLVLIWLGEERGMGILLFLFLAFPLFLSSFTE